MNNRISLVLKAKNISPAQLADELGVQRSGISHIMNGRNKPSLDFVQKLIRLYPDISMQWLLFGEGPMMNPYPSGNEAPDKKQPDAGIKPKPLMMELFPDERTAAVNNPALPEEKIEEEPGHPADKQFVEQFIEQDETDAPIAPEKKVPQNTGLNREEKVSGVTEKKNIPGEIKSEREHAKKSPAQLIYGRRLVRIVMFYSDKTFSEFYPEGEQESETFQR